MSKPSGGLRATRYREIVENTEPAETVDEPNRAPGGWRGVALPALVATAGAAAVAMVHFRDPHIEGSYGMCPVYLMFGMYCPGCGGMRAVHNLTDGQLLDSLHSNLLALPLLIAFTLWVGDWTIRAWRGEPMRIPGISTATMWMCFAFLGGYTVLRNTPWGFWLTPV